MSFIYKVTNKVNSKCYIGKTDYTDPTKRYKEHIKESRKNRNKNRPLYSAIRKHGEDSFIFAVIEETDEPLEREIYYIKYFNSFGSNGYNATKGGDGKSYISATDEDVVNYFLSCKSTIKTSTNFLIDRKTVRSILRRNGIEKLSRSYIANKNFGLSICQIDILSGKDINRFDSINSAARFIGNVKKSRHLSRALNGQCKTAFGFAWRYSP
jgi:group I intron endonuclease